jgi:hypothetical protein
VFFKLCSNIRIIKSKGAKKWNMMETQEKRENNADVLLGKPERDRWKDVGVAK